MLANKIVPSVFTAYVLIWGTYALLQDVPPPIELSKCLRTEMGRNKITEVFGEKLNNICEDMLLMKHKKKVKFEPTQKDIDTVNSILLRYIAKTRRTRRQTRQIEWRQRRNRRKEIRRLNRAERRRLFRAFQAIKRNGIYDSIAAIHRGESRLLRAHGGANFLSWHRILLKVLELSLQDHDRRIRLPYFDSSMDFYVDRPEESVVWTDEIFGNCRGDVIEGPFANWRLGLDPNETLFRNCGSGGSLMTKEGIRRVMRADYHANITDFRNILQFLEGYHNGVHVWIDGWMRLLYAASEDPVFFFHHCFIDYLWYKFRQRQRLRGIDTESDYPPSLSNSLHWANATMDPFYFMSNSDGYLDMWEAGYDETPSCNRRRRRRCGSRQYLRCNYNEERCETLVVPRPAPVEPPVPLIRNAGGENSATGFLSRISGVQPFKVEPIRLNSLPADAAEFSSPWTDVRTRNTAPLPSRQSEATTVRKKRSVSVALDHKTEKSYQNSFMLDGVADTSLWAFFPVKIIYKRPPGTQYNSKIVRKGKKLHLSDIYSPSNYPNLRDYISTSFIANNGKCFHSGAGETKIYFQSQGIDYNGFYKDYFIIDGKQAIGSSYGYIAMKNPGNSSAMAYLSAYDTCGRMCRTTCKIKDSKPADYKSCSGTVKITPELPKMYGVNYGEAVSLLWNLDREKAVPSANDDQVFITFYCDYQPTWPWTF